MLRLAQILTRNERNEFAASDRVYSVKEDPKRREKCSESVCASMW